MAMVKRMAYDPGFHWPVKKNSISKK